MAAETESDRGNFEDATSIVRLEESNAVTEKRRIETRYGEAELKLPEDVELKVVVGLLNASRSHD